MYKTDVIKAINIMSACWVHTSRFRYPWWLLLIGRFIAIVVLFLPTSSSYWAEQYPTGLKEGNDEWLFGLRPVSPDDSSRFYVNTSPCIYKKKTWLLKCMAYFITTFMVGLNKYQSKFKMLVLKFGIYVFVFEILYYFIIITRAETSIET